MALIASVPFVALLPFVAAYWDKENGPFGRARESFVSRNLIHTDQEIARVAC
jgi:hypothetical protein